MKHGFVDEVRKLANAELAGRVARKFLGSSARSAAMGAVVGGGLGLASAPEGEGRLQHGMRGALTGTAAGAVSGLIGRRAIDHTLIHPGATPGQAAMASASSIGTSLKNFGKRQIHGFTGAWGDKPESIGMPGRHVASKKLELAAVRNKDMLARARSPKERERILEKYDEVKKDIIREGSEGDARTRAGITSLPGMAKGLATNPRETSKEMLAAATGGSLSGAGLAFGVPLGLSGPGLLKGDESAEGGPTMRRKALMLGANVAGGVATAGLPFIPQFIASGATDALVTPRAHATGEIAQRGARARRPAIASPRANEQVT